MSVTEVRAELVRTGHGHVVPRTDGMRARCGGPGMCSTCGAHAARWAKVNEDAATDPFPITPPSHEESARVVSEAALLTAAADRLDLMHCEGSPIPWLPELVAVLLAAAQQAVEVGADWHAVALARQIIADPR